MKLRVSFHKDHLDVSGHENPSAVEVQLGGKFLGNGPLGTLVEEVALAVMLLRDVATRRYVKLPVWAIAALVFLAFYVGNPVDLVPDFLVGVGQLDDFIVLGLTLMLLRQEIYEYKHWLATHQRREPEPLAPDADHAETRHAEA